jgi:hypothetical protein
MNTPSPCPDLLQVARRLIWFEPPETALKQPVRLLAYAFRYATPSDIKVLRLHFSAEDFVEALEQAPPGVIDARSWAYWNWILRGLAEPPPMPRRTFGETEPENRA